MKRNKQQEKNSSIKLLQRGGSLRNKGGFGESKHKGRLRLDVSASVSVGFSGCGTRRGDNGSVNWIYLIRDSKREDSPTLRSLTNPWDPRG